MLRKTLLAIAAIAAIGACTDDAVRKGVKAPTLSASSPGLARRAVAALPGAPDLPAMRWDGRANSDDWTEATLAALKADGAPLMSRVPSDVMEFCPGYARQTPVNRQAFWAGLLSAVARHESGHNALAKGAGGRYVGLMQISGGTARANGCAGSMLDGRANMACAVRIVTKQVSRDNAIARGGSGWRGVARDWMVLRNSGQRQQIATWTKAQSYCK